MSWNLLPRHNIITNMALRFCVYVILGCNILNIYASHHWIVTENGRIEEKLESAFPLRRPYDLVAMLDQEKRVVDASEMDQTLVRLKKSLDTQWANVELETEFEKRLYATDSNCLDAEVPLSQYSLEPVFVDILFNKRPKLSNSKLNKEPPDCAKYYELDFSLLTFPHLKTLRDRQNISTMVEEIESEAPMDIDIEAMLTKNNTDWTAYNLAVHYWQKKGNATNAIECARRAVYFAPREHRYIALLNLGTLLQSCHSLGEAAIVLHTAVDLDRGQYRSHVALGHVYALLGDYDRASGCYANALALRPDLSVLMKQRSAVLCHQKLVTGLWALDAALRKIVDGLETYGQLQQKWLRAHARITDERDCASVHQPLPDNLHHLWNDLEREVLVLTERMTQVDPTTRSKKEEAEQGSDFYVTAQSDRRQFKTDVLLTCAIEKCPEYAMNLKKDKERPSDDPYLQLKVFKLHGFISSTRDVGPIPMDVFRRQIIEKLVTLEGNYFGYQPQDSSYWVTLRKCIALVESDALDDDCGHRTLLEYVLQVNADIKPQDPGSQYELVDESGIETYIDDRSESYFEYRDRSEL